MESNKCNNIPNLNELENTEIFKNHRPFFEGFRSGYFCGRSDGYDEGWDEGYDEGYSDALEESDDEESFELEKPEDEESLLEFLDTLSLAEQRAALVHLSVKWAETEEKKKNERE